MAEDREIDLAGIEQDYIANIKSNVVISKEYGISEGTVRKYAKKYGWVKNLKEKINKRADEIVRDSAVRDSVRTNERVVIETNAVMQANIILSHRKDINRYRALCDGLIDELNQQTGERITFEELVGIISGGDESGIDRAFRKALSTPSRVDSAKKLVDTFKVLIGLERQAFNISDNANGDADKPVTEITVTYV